MYETHAMTSRYATIQAPAFRCGFSSAHGLRSSYQAQTGRPTAMIRMTLPVSGQRPQYRTSEPKTIATGAMYGIARSLTGRLRSGERRRSDITATGPVMYEITVATETISASEPQPRKTARKRKAMNRFSTSAGRGTPVFLSTLPKIFGRWPFSCTPWIMREVVAA